MNVDFLLRPACPFAWVTSVDPRGGAAARPHPAFRVMSLLRAHEHREIEDWYRIFCDNAGVRFGSASPPRSTTARRCWRDLYTALGTRIHNGRNKNYAEVIARRWPRSGCRRPRRGRHQHRLRRGAAKEPPRGHGSVGDEVGTPRSLDRRVAFFGPVLNDIPRARGRELFDAVRTLAAYPRFFELKRSRTGEFDFS